MVAKVAHKVRSLKLWSAITGVVLVVALVLTFLPMQVTIDTGGLLSISLNQASANPGWLSGWAKRVQLTADHTDVSANLTNFPILLYLSTSSGRNTEDISFVFDELASDANLFKIAVTTSDGVTQCYVEIEKWDDANEHAWLWVKVPSLSSTTDDNFYLYYDSTHADNTDYVGDIDSTPGGSVWDSNYKFVGHMVDATTSTIKDSTTNSYDGTKKAANEPIVTTSGKIGDAQSYDGSDDYIGITTMGIFGTVGQYTFEGWIKTSIGNAYMDTSGTANLGSTNNWRSGIVNYAGPSQGAMTIYLRDDTGKAIFAFINTDTGITDSNWHYLFTTIQGSTNTVTINIDGVSQNVSYSIQTTPSSFSNWTYPMYIGAYDNRGATANSWNGTLDEIRMSDTIRSAAWAKAAYETERDHLLDWGGEAPAISYFIYKKEVKFDTSVMGANITTNQTSFPVCVHINTSSWTNSTERDNFFGAWNVGGKRCQFFDADGTTNLDYEVELYSQGDEEAIYWVRVPQVDGNSTSDYIWCAFGNDSNGTNQDNKTGVWTSTYKFVNHLADWNIEAYKSQVINPGEADLYWAMEPMVIYRAGETHPWKMWTHGFGGSLENIVHWYSDDGETWTRYGQILASYIEPFVLYNPEGDGKYWMYAKPWTGSWGTSLDFDLLTGTETSLIKDTDSVITVGAAGKFDHGCTFNPTVWYEEPDSTANLATSMDDSTTECDVTDTTKFAANQYIKVESEWMLVTAIINSTHCHVTRERLGTSAVAHTQPQDVYKRQWYMAYGGNGGPQGGVILVGLALSYDGRSWTKQYNGSGDGGSWLFTGESGSDAGTIYKVDGIYYHCGHGGYLNQTGYGTDIQGWSSSSDLASWTPLGTTGYESFISRTQVWEGNAHTNGQTADICGLVDNNANPIIVGGYLRFYYDGLMQQAIDSNHPCSVGLVKLPGTFNQWVINSPATLADSTSNNNNPGRREYLMAAAGQVGNGEEWRNAATGKTMIRFPDSASHDLGTSFTFAASVYLDAYITGPDLVFNKDACGAAGTRQFLVYLDGAEDNTKKPAIYYWDTDNHAIQWVADAAQDMTTGWHIIAWVRDANTAVYIYVDGTAVANTKTGTLDAAMQSTTQPLYIGYRPYDDDGIDGNLDELRMSNTAYSADWAKLEYYSMKKTNFNGDSWISWSSAEGAQAPAITNIPNSKDFGVLEVNTTSATAINYFTIENTGNCAVDVTIQGTDMTGGGHTWTLSDTATPGNMIYGLKAGLDDADDLFDVVVNTTANAFISDLPEATTQAWGLKIWAPTSYDDGNLKTGNVTLTASYSG